MFGKGKWVSGGVGPCFRYLPKVSALALRAGVLRCDSISVQCDYSATTVRLRCDFSAGRLQSLGGG